MKHKAFICFMLISVMCECFARNYILIDTYNVDSLFLVLPGQQAEERVNSLNKLVISLAFDDDDRWLEYADEALNLAEELNYEEGMADAFRNNGHIYQYQGNYPQALNNYYLALSLYEKLDNQKLAGWVCHDIGKTHYFANNYEKAIEYGHMALDKYRKLTDKGIRVGDVRDTVYLYGALAEVYASMRMPGKAIGYYLEALDVMQENNFAYSELVINTFTVGAGYLNLGEIDSAKVYFHMALEYPDKNLNVEALKYRVFQSLGILHYSIGEADTAVYYLEKAFNWYNKNGFLFWALAVSNELGNIHYENDDYKGAEKYLLESERTFNEMVTRNSWYRYDSLKHIAAYGFELYFPLPPARLKEMMWASGQRMNYGLYQINAEKNRINEALKYYISYSEAKDTLNKLQRHRETIELQTRYESDRKDQQIENLSFQNELTESRLDQNRYIFIGAVGLLIIILILVYILFRQNRLRTNQQMILLQQKFFRSQMNPHFIFNSLASIQGFIADRDPRTANSYLARFATLVRNILDSSAEEYIPLEKEFKTIENYLELQKVRYEGKFNYKIEVDDKIDPETMMIPPMLTQPFIENSIEHGFKNQNTIGNIYISFTYEDNLILVEIKDDGIGREKAQELLFRQNKEHKPMATTIIMERIKVLNKKLKNKITLNIIDLKNDRDEQAGTKVVLKIPFK